MNDKQPQNSRQRFRLMPALGILLSAMALALAQCGDIGQDGQTCLVEGFAGGTFAFTVDGIDDQCMKGILEDYLMGASFDRVVLPATEDLPKSITLSLTGVGEIVGTLWTDGTVLQLSAAADLSEIEIPEVGTFSLSATADGTLCPTPEDQVQATLNLRVESVEFEGIRLDEACSITLTATGYLQD